MNQETDKNLIKKKRIKVIVIAIAVVIVTALVSVFLGKELVAFVSDSSKVRELVSKHWLLSRLIFIAVTLVQIILAVIPGEPVELAAGYAFGTIEGTILCLIGAAIGGMTDFFIVRTIGIKAVKVFFTQDKIDRLKFLKASKQRDFWMFMLMFIPGTPKDILSYVAGLTDIKWYRWLLLSCCARIPSILTSTMSADALGTQKYVKAAIVYGVTLIISLAGMLAYNKITDYHTKKEKNAADAGKEDPI